METELIPLRADLAQAWRKASQDQRRRVEEAVEGILAINPDSYQQDKPHEPLVSAYEVSKHLAGSLKGGPSDLATNPKYMEGFGESSLR